MVVYISFILPLPSLHLTVASNLHKLCPLIKKDRPLMLIYLAPPPKVVTPNKTNLQIHQLSHNAYIMHAGMFLPQNERVCIPLKDIPQVYQCMQTMMKSEKMSRRNQSTNQCRQLSPKFKKVGMRNKQKE